MKHLFRFASYGCLVASMALVACSDDNDTPDNPGGSNTPSVPSVDNVFTEAAPATIDGYQFTTNDKGQVTNIKDQWEDITIEYGTFTFTRAEEKFQAKATFKYEGEVESVVYLQFNNQGFISYALQDYVDADDTDTWKFGYNNAGQMTSLQRSEGGDDFTMTYTDGDLTKVVWKDEDGDTDVITISYTNDTHKTPVANKANVMLFDETFDIDMDEMSILYYAGLLGKATKNLPMKLVASWSDGDESTYTFFWEFDSNNLPTKFWSQYNDNDYKDSEVDFSWK